MLALPRSARLTCWTNSWLSGRTSLEEATDAVQHAEGPASRAEVHHVIGVPGEDAAIPLLFGLGALRRSQTTHCSLALPAPGDPLGLAGPPPFNEAAFEAEEAVVFEGSGLGLVPHVVGAGVQWQVYTAVPAAPVGMGDASTDLTRTLHDAIEILARFATASRAPLNPDLADALTDLRANRRATAAGLAPGYDARADQLAMRAETCLAVCELATGDDQTLSAHDSDLRRRALRALEVASRRALVAAVAPPR